MTDRLALRELLELHLRRRWPVARVTLGPGPLSIPLLAVTLDEEADQLFRDIGLARVDALGWLSARGLEAVDAVLTPPGTHFAVRILR